MNNDISINIKMAHDQMISYLVEKREYSSFLEIGVWGGRTNPPHNRIVCKNKIGVDPDTNFGSMERVIPWTSDQYFDFLYRYTNNVEFDIIFIDGLHTEEQVDKDIENSLNFLSEDGLIMLHDCSPPTEWHARPLEEFDGTGQWNGTSYRSVVKLRCTDENMNILTVDDDWGCSIIDPSGTQKIFSDIPLDEILKDFSVFDQHRKEVLNLISVEEFLEIYK